MKEIVTKEGRTLLRLSRWIKVQQGYNITPRHSLYDQCTDENGFYPGQSMFNPENGTFLDFFRFNGRKYAINQFIIFGGCMGGYPPMWEDEDGKIHYLSGYDSEDYYNPIMIESSEYCEYVRVYQEV